MSGCHAILTGACNSGDRSFSLGNIDSISFLAYASGCNLVILSFNFQRVQIIPGDVQQQRDGKQGVQIICVHCSSESGKIAAAYQNKIKIFEPSLNKVQDHPNPLFNYRWKETFTLECDCRVNSLSWDPEGFRLLSGGSSLQMWKLVKKFTIDPGENQPPTRIQWECIWKCKTATEVHFLSFSPDACLFATAGKFDRLVKIWYPITRFAPNPDEITYDFVYLAHPRAVTGFSWRQTSKYMPKSAVFNALITSCLDKICRIWTETVLPEDGFSINVNRDLQPGSDSKFHRTHKHRIMKRLQHVKACFHLKKHRHKETHHSMNSPFPLPSAIAGSSLGMSMSSLDYAHSNALAYHGACIHFHLAGSINAETDIPLVPPLKNHNFRVFWLNNKEMFFTQQAEAILQELCRRGLERDESFDNITEERNRKTKVIGKVQSQDESGGDDGSSQQSLSSAASSGSLIDGNDSPSIDILDQKLEGLLRDWHKTPDILVSLHPIDGSFLVWSIEWLDEYMPGCFRQSQVSFSSRIPGAIPLADATSMSSPNLYLFPLEKLASNRAAMMTKHHNGTLNLWALSFGDDSKFCQVLSVAHAKRASGHRFQVREMTCHPVLPLILTAASHAYQEVIDESQAGFGGGKQLSQNYCSELILWRVDPIGPLCKSGGVVEVARINSTEVEAFTHVAWVPGLLPSTSLFSNSGCFVASDGSNLRVYQAVLDASNLLAEISTAFRKRKASLNSWFEPSDSGSDDSRREIPAPRSSSSSLSSIHGAIEDAGDSDLFVVSQQSTSRPGCILQLDRIDNQMQGEVSFIQVFRDDLDAITRGGLDYREAFHVVLIQNQHEVHVWRIEISTPSHVMEGHEFYEDIEASASHPGSNNTSGHFAFDVPPSNHNNNNLNPLAQNEPPLPGLVKSGLTLGSNTNKKSFLNISISKILEQTICPGFDVTFSACHGHFVCGTSYALISTTKQYVKLWKLQRKNSSDVDTSNLVNSSGDGEHQQNGKLNAFEFREWNTLKAEKEGRLIEASAAYSGRIACVYKLKTAAEHGVIESPGGTKRDNNLCAVTVYECESTGGTEWLLEDTIELRTDDEVAAVHLEWVPKHDAQFILALAISDMICLFAHVSKEPSITFGAKALPSTTSCKSQYWLPLHAFKLSSADGLRPFPVRFGWIHAVCVVAMRNEMQIYSQWALENLTDVSNLFPACKSVTAKSSSVEEKEKFNSKPWLDLALLSGSVGLFQYTRHCYPVLPQYHPKQLMEMLNSGKVRWVKVILAHLVRCLTGSSGGLKRQNSTLHEDPDGRVRSRSRALSVSYSGPTPPSPLEHRNSMLFEEFNLNYAEIKSISPVPLWMLLLAEKEIGQLPSEDKTKDYNDLFNVESVDEPMDESVFDDILDDEDGMGGSGGTPRQRRRSASGDNQPLSYGPRQSRILSRVLTHAQLPGLTSLDQMHLLALADTVASIGTRLDHHADVTTQKQIHDGTPDSLDDCGLRFLLVVKHYSYLLRCLPPAQRAQLQQQGISSSDIVWAFHSESQEDILNLIPAYQKGEASWPQLRELGVGWWLRNNQTLRTCVEKMAKYAYQKGNDPMDAAIFYLAMKKKTLLWGLYRSKRDEKMATFFSNDFSQERWRKAALKNAYALLGKQRFEHAAAFFLLAGSMKDALEVCLAKLKDIQLALVVGRLYEGGDMDPTPPSVRQLLQSEIINDKKDEEGENQQDPFLRSMALWMLKEYQSSLDTLLLHNSSSSRFTGVFNFYVYLRTHPLLVRQNKAKGTLALSHTERNLYFQTAHAHYAAGCPTLAIHVLAQLPKIVDKSSRSLISSPIKSPKITATTDARIESGMLEHHHNVADKLFDPPKDATKDSGLEFDWSAPATTNFSSSNRLDDELKLDWDDDDTKSGEEEVDDASALNGGLVKDNKKLGLPMQGQMDKSFSKDESLAAEDGEEDLNDPHTMIAIELKLASCLKLMSEELVTMVGQIEGTELRLHLYAWLERQVPTLKELCRYKSDDDDDVNLSDDWSKRERSLTPRLESQSSGLHDILLSEKLDLEWKMGVLSRRSRWLRANRHLLATLLAFARLHAHSLAPVHIELVFLLDELQREKSSGTGPSLVSPLPLLHSEFPLLSAVANPNKSAVSYIQSSARDILHTISELIAVPVFPLKAEEVFTQTQPLLPLSSTNPYVPSGTPTATLDNPMKDEESSAAAVTAAEGNKDVNDNHEVHNIGADEHEEGNWQDEDGERVDSPTGDANDGESPSKSKNRRKRNSESCSVMKEEEVSSTVCDWRLVLVLRDSGVALSSCLFQALSDSEGANDGISGKDVGVQLLYTPRRRRWSSDRDKCGVDGSAEKVISTPDKWPGVAILRGMLSREEDEENPKLKYLLVECYAAVFASLFVHSIAVCDPKMIYRILAKKMDAQSFATIFGGGSKRQIKISTLQQLHPQSQSSSSEKDGGDTSPSSVWTTLASLNKARMKFNMKLLGQQFNLTSPRTPTVASSKEERPSFREKFVPPEIAIYTYLMSTPRPRLDEADGKLEGGQRYEMRPPFVVDSDEEEELEDEQEEEEEEDYWDTKGVGKSTKIENKEDEPFSYSWRLMRLAAVKLAKMELQRIVSIVGIDTTELSHVSPYLDGMIRVLTVWQDRLFKELETLAPAPLHFLPNSSIESIGGPPINKYRALLDPTNTPFPQRKVTFGLRRLWNMLVREDTVQDYFVRFVFGKRRQDDAMSLWEMSVDTRLTKKEDRDTADEFDDEPLPIGPVRIVHKEHESISAFCVNQCSPGLMSISTPKEIQELDVGVLLDMETWKFEDQFEFDLLNLYKDPETVATSSYLVVQSPSDRSMAAHMDKPQKGSHSLIKGLNFPGCTDPNFVQFVIERSRRYLVPILKHRVDGVRRMASHASLPLYLSGSQDGSVRLWEFSHAQPVSVPRPPGTFAKVTRIRFHGSKFGVTDSDGRLSLWQIGANPRPFYTIQCHTKQTSDFVFLGSSSLIASAGMNSDSKNVALWDTLMPMKKAQIASFTCHEQGCVALAYAEEHQCLISAGKKGAICIWDVRQRSLRHRFQGHESAIKCLCLDPAEEYYCTGSADGDIKVWDFSGKARSVFQGEHSRSGFFKNIPGQGVTQLLADSHRRLYSCGADGSVKIRVLSFD